MKENQDIEYKQVWKDEYLKWIAGFANADGGIIYIGINDSGEIIGIDKPDKLMEDIPNKIVNYLGIVADVNMLLKEKKYYLEIIVQPSSVPVSYKGVYYYRSGSTKQELKGTALHQFLVKRIGRSWDDLPCEYAKMDDIDENAVNYFFRKAELSNRLTKRLEDDNLFTVLENLNLVTDDRKLKNAALFLFGKNPSRFLTGVSFKIGRFVEGNDDLRFQDVVEGNIIEMAE